MSQRDPDLGPAVDPVSAILETVTAERDTARTVAVALEQQLADATEVIGLVVYWQKVGAARLPAPVELKLGLYVERWATAPR